MSHGQVPRSPHSLAGNSGMGWEQLQPPQMCHPGPDPAPQEGNVSPAEPSKNWAIKAGKRRWCEDAVFGINLCPPYQRLLGFGMSSLPSQHWEFWGCQRETHKYLSLSEACLCLTSALSGDCKAQRKIKCSFHQAGLANYLGKKFFLEFSCFLKKKRK